MHVNIYDFDGVIASPFEEALFGMEPLPEDTWFIQDISRRYNLDLRSENALSQRYICIQALLYHMNERIRIGPMFDKLEGPYHIMTARTDRFAVMRMHSFMRAMKLTPIKVMHVDHLAKGEMMKVLVDRHPETSYHFWDDNIRHIKSCEGIDRVTAFHVDNPMESFYREAQEYYREHLVKAVL